MHAELKSKIQQLKGPILVLGASGFIGANLLKLLAEARQDVHGTSGHCSPWRLRGMDGYLVLLGDTGDTARTVFNLVAYGAYSWQTELEMMYHANVHLTASRLEHAVAFRHTFINAGSSSEYGANCYRPQETAALTPNSHYACSKAAASGLISYFGQHRRLRCCNLRLYSVYGPMEDPSRLIPQLIIQGSQGKYPPLVDSGVTRDFVYVDDVCEAFVNAALYLLPEEYGGAFNIGTGMPLTIRAAAKAAQDVFGIRDRPKCATMKNRDWDPEYGSQPWCARILKAQELLKWQPRTSFEDGFRRTLEWYQGLGEKDRTAYANVRMQT